MEKTEKKKKGKVRKIIGWVITGIFGVLFVLVLTFQIISMNSAKNNYGVPNFNGFQTLVVLTDSMEPDYQVGSACFVQKDDVTTYKIGDDITFYYSPWSSYMSNPIVTHRIREIKIDETKEVGKGRYTFIVGGINKDSDQAWEVSGHTTRDCTNQTQTVSDSVVLGRVIGNSKAVGVLYSFITSTWGLITLILIPCLYLIISFGIDLFKTAKKEEAIETSETSENVSKSRIDTLSSEEKERLKQELLEKMIEEKKNENK